MAAKVYAVLFHVTERDLGTVLSALSGSSTLISVTPTTVADGDNGIKKQFRYAGGKKSKGITGDELALKILSSENRVFPLHELKNKFLEAGFAHTSAAPNFNKLAREKKIRALGDNKFCALGVTLRL